MTSFAIFTQAMKASLSGLYPLLRARWPLFLLLHAAYFAAEQYFRFAEEVASQRASESLGLLAANASLAVSFDLFWYSAFFALTVKACSDLKAQRQTPPGEVLIRYLNPLVIENIRVLARVIFWLPFLVLPALYNYVRLFFVSFVVVEEPLYEMGQLNAFNRSREVSRGRAGLTLIATLTSLALAPLLSTLITGGETAIWHNPVRALLAMPVIVLVNVWSILFLFSIFKALTGLMPGSEA
jgi:hypothetical protein